MIVSFVFEEKQPFLRFAVNVNVHFNGASINLIRFIELVKLSVLFKIFNGNRCNIHKIYRLCAPKLAAHGNITVVRPAQNLVLKPNAVNRC